MTIDVSVILPCRNEEKTIGQSIEQIISTFKKNKITGEIIVSDSSTDKSPKIAKKYNVRLVRHNKKGYGIACMEAIKYVKGRDVIIGDADGTYDFTEIPLLLNKLKQNNDLVIGSRINGDIKNGAMPFMHRHIGNPALSYLLNLFFHTSLSDTNSGFRAIKKAELKKMDLKTTGMEFASEMIIKAAKNNLKIAEVPITYYPRVGQSKLKSFSDGWRHLRFMLMFSPTHLFFIPGLFLFSIGMLFLTAMLFTGIKIGTADITTYLTLMGALFSISGYQIINLGLYSRIYAIHSGIEKEDKLIDFIAEKISLEKGILLGMLILIMGILSFFLYLVSFLSDIPNTIKPEQSFFGLTFVIIGIQTIFSVFFISMMLVERKENI
jgi:glycosyltransferase involved in cell wall biosynthesis